MDEPKSKAAKAAKDSIPWAAVIVAVLGWYDARGTGKDAAKDAAAANSKAAVVQVASAQSDQNAEERLRAAYHAMQDVVANNAERIDDLEGWVVELEEWVEDAVEDDSPRTRAERAEREERLAEIRRNKTQRRAEKLNAPPAASKLPDFDALE